jgi:hypothetical protein
MSRNGDIVQSLGGEERTFRFGLAEHRRLQERLNIGLSLIVQNLHPFMVGVNAKMTMGQILSHRLLGDLRPDHIGEVVFQGLVGGGMDPTEAGRLRKTWVDERPLTETAPIAYAIGLAALMGPDDEPAAGESEGGEAGSPSRKAKSGSARTASTPSARRRPSRQGKSTA